MNKQLKAKIDKCHKSYAAQQNMNHEVACECIEHALVHGDITPLEYFLQGFGSRSQTRHTIAAWVRHHGRYETPDGKSAYFVYANINDAGEVKVKIAEQAIRSQYTVEPFKALPYWEAIDIVKTKTAWELQTALVRLVKKATEEGKTAQDIKAALSDALKAVAA